MIQNSNFYKELIDNLYDGIYFVDRERVITYWNKGAERITGYSAEQAVGRSCKEKLLNHVTAEGTPLCDTACPMAACMEDGLPREADVFLHHISGHRVPVRVRAAPIRNEDGRIIGAVETFSANENMVKARHEIWEMRHAALSDHLTGIGNRRFLEGRLRAVIAEYSLGDGNAGLLFIDVDHFKKFNDIYGHELGDKMLKMVASSLSHNLRATDNIGRWGGEEFMVIVHEVQGREGLLTIASKLQKMVEWSRYDLGNESLTVTISIGATLLHPDDTAESFVRRADQLMYQSKRTGRNRITFG